MQLDFEDWNETSFFLYQMFDIQVAEECVSCKVDQEFSTFLGFISNNSTMALNANTA